MFERFTARARKAVDLARDEARALGHGAVGSEHLLLGLLREEEGLAARVLESFGVDLADVRELVVRRTRRPTSGPRSRPRRRTSSSAAAGRRASSGTATSAPIAVGVVVAVLV